MTDTNSKIFNLSGLTRLKHNSESSDDDIKSRHSLHSRKSNRNNSSDYEVDVEGIVNKNLLNTPVKLNLNDDSEYESSSSFSASPQQSRVSKHKSDHHERLRSRSHSSNHSGGHNNFGLNNDDNDQENDHVNSHSHGHGHGHEIDHGRGGVENGHGHDTGHRTHSNDSDDDKYGIKHLSRSEITRKKTDMLIQINKYERQGISSMKKYSLSDRYEDIFLELERLKDQKSLKTNLKYYGSSLVNFAKVIEVTNQHTNYFGIDLVGWSEQLSMNVDDHEYDEVFEELHEKYKEVVSMPPELKLLGMFVFSGLSFWGSREVLKKAVDQLPGAAEIFKNNPKLEKDYIEESQKIINKSGDNSKLGQMMQGTPFAQAANYYGGLKNREDNNLEGNENKQRKLVEEPVLSSSVSDLLNQMSKNPTSEKILNIDDTTSSFK